MLDEFGLRRAREHGGGGRRFEDVEEQRCVYGRGDALWCARWLEWLIKLLLLVGQRWLLFLECVLAAFIARGWGLDWRGTMHCARYKADAESVQGWREYKVR